MTSHNSYHLCDAISERYVLPAASVSDRSQTPPAPHLSPLASSHSRGAESPLATLRTWDVPWRQNSDPRPHAVESACSIVHGHASPTLGLTHHHPIRILPLRRRLSCDAPPSYDLRPNLHAATLALVRRPAHPLASCIERAREAAGCPIEEAAIRSASESVHARTGASPSLELDHARRRRAVTR